MAIELRVADNCWICEGWRQETFEFTPGVSSDLPDGADEHDAFVPIYLHLDQDDFRADLMLPQDPDASKVKYISTRMVAPGKSHRYFFSIAGKTYIAKDQASKTQRPAVKAVNSLGLPSEEAGANEAVFDPASLPALNVMTAVQQNFASYDAHTILAMKCKPRTLKKLGARDKLRTPWKFTNSCFKSYKPDTAALLDKCFEFDWEFIESKVEYLIKNSSEREKVKKYLKKNYKLLRDAYKLTAGQDAQGNQMSIGKNSFGALMQ